MFSRLLTAALLTAGTALAVSTAQAQTSGSSGTGSSSGGTTMSPSTSPSTGTSSQQAQQPMGSGAFDASNYKTKAECLTAATAQHADRTLCNALK